MLKENIEKHDAVGGAVRHFFVINPHSFRKPDVLERALSDIKAAFPAGCGVECEIYTSRYPRDAVAAVHRYVSRFPASDTVRVYAVGGDGILSECLNGMVDFPNAELTNVPYGSANDFIRGAFGDTARERFRDIKALRDAPARPIDIMRCGSNYGINEAIIGLSGQSILYANAILRGKYAKWFNPFIVTMVYKICVVCAIFVKELMTQRYRAELDGKDFSGGYFSIHVSNGPCDGNTIVPSPYAKVNDGLLNVTFGRWNGILHTIRTSNEYMEGRFEKFPNTYSLELCRKIELNSDLPIRVAIDGEAFSTDKLTIEVLPGRIKFAAPADMDFVDHTHRAYKGGSGGAR